MDFEILESTFCGFKSLTQLPLSACSDKNRGRGWWGNLCEHYAEPNRSGSTRVSGLTAISTGVQPYGLGHIMGCPIPWKVNLTGGSEKKSQESYIDIQYVSI